MLGVIAIKMTGVKLEWDAAAMKFTNCDEANRFVNPKCRQRLGSVSVVAAGGTAGQASP